MNELENWVVPAQHQNQNAGNQEDQISVLARSIMRFTQKSIFPFFLVEVNRKLMRVTVEAHFPFSLVVIKPAR